MRRIAIAALLLLCILSASSAARAGIGWCGQIWPVDGASYTSAQDIDVYVQVWKEGVTDQPGQGEDIGSILYYRCKGDPGFTDVDMTYNGDIGNNDEYTGIVPSGHGCDTLEFYVAVIDSTDMDECLGQDQNSNDPNFFLPITDVTSQDVTVSFHLCLTTGVETSGDVCVIGDHAEIGNWGTGVTMSLECPLDSQRTYKVDVLFAAGSNPSVQYKFKKDGCETWETTANRSFAIDDAEPTMDLPVDGWELAEPDCPPCEDPVEDASWGAIKAVDW